MARKARPALATGACAAVIVAFAACGGEDAQLLPGATAREINDNLDKVAELSEEGDCPGAESAAAQVAEQVAALQGVDEKLKRALTQGAERLNAVVDECEASQVETEPTTTPDEAEEEAGEKAAEEKEKEQEKEEKDREKEEEKREKEEAAQPPATEEPPAGDELPPQANGEAKGHEEKPPPAAEGEEVGPSGGVGPSAPVGEG
jgi:septal ring factor EnvC (AmiA/AmiB activator)